jgi:PAS domain S-box-containing protein
MLPEPQDLYVMLIGALKDYAIFTIDAKGCITTWNPGCVRMKQFTDEDTMGQHFQMLYPLEGRRRNEPDDHLHASLTEGRFRGEGLRLKKDGSTFLADVTIIPLYSGGEHIGFGKVVQNLDEHNRLIQERDLSRSQMEALKIDQGLREHFIATLSHDLRTPLSAAKMSAQLIARNPGAIDQNSKLAARISNNVDRMDGMIRDLLDASLLRAGESVPVQIRECDLCDIASRVCDELATIHGDRFRLKSTSPLVGYWCADGMTRILENLLSNAAKYGRNGTPITTELREVDDRVLMTVHNLGTAISPEDQATLFEAFHRSYSATSGDQGGWGLGLSVVRGLVEANGGVVIVESYPKLGTRFTVDLPRDARFEDGSVAPPEGPENTTAGRKAGPVV